jgi:hypothetical protein
MNCEFKGVNVKITIEDNVASRSFVNECIVEQLDSMGYKILNYYDAVVDKDPIRSEEIKKGFILKKTYHKWWWKVIYKLKLAELEGQGNFKLYISVPNNKETLENTKVFIKGLEDKLEDLKESLEIVFIRVSKFEEIQTDDIPCRTSWY